MRYQYFLLKGDTYFYKSFFTTDIKEWKFVAQNGVAVLLRCATRATSCNKAQQI